MTSVDVGGQTILGCPISSYLSLETACSITKVPACATATSINYDAACCGSLTSYGLSLFSCFEKHAPTCLDTSAIAASLTGGISGTNPCAAYATPGGGGGGSSAAPTTSAAVLTSAGSGTATAGTGGSAATTAAAGGSIASSAGSSASASATAKSGAPNVGVGLKVYIGVALVGALAVLAM